MSDVEDSTPQEFYAAYLTTGESGGPRAPVTAERIVIVLGHDGGGRPLELSVDLTKSDDSGKLTCYAILEPLLDPSRPSHIPVTVVEQRHAPNVFQVSIHYDDLSRPGEGARAKEKPAKKSDACCSFCSRSRTRVGPLVEGGGPEGTGGVFICRECTELSLAIHEQEQERRRRTKNGSGDESNAKPT